MPRYARPSKATRLHSRTTGNVVNIRIKGKKVDQSYAVVMYRCRECLGRLRKRDAGLTCLDDEDHRGFIHKREAEKIFQAEVDKQTKIEAVYKIVDGVIVVKER